MTRRRHKVATDPRILSLRIDESLYFANARAIEDFAHRRDSLDYAVDGMVVRIDRFDGQDRLGATAKSPR